MADVLMDANSVVKNKGQSLQGIILGKRLIKEKDLICDVLLSNGKKKSFYVLGGYGSAKKQKGTVFEVGYVLNFNLKLSKRSQSLQLIDEYRLKFVHEKIRYQIRSYYLLIIMLKVSQLVSLEQEIEHESEDEKYLYKICSNAIYYLDKNAKSNIYTHLLCFLTKMCIYSGVFPDLTHCGFCHRNLEREKKISFIVHEGYFSCSNCSSDTSDLAAQLRKALSFFSQNLYSQINFEMETDSAITNWFLDFFLLHHHMDRRQLNIPKDFI